MRIRIGRGTGCGWNRGWRRLVQSLWAENMQFKRHERFIHDFRKRLRFELVFQFFHEFFPDFERCESTPGQEFLMQVGQFSHLARNRMKRTAWMVHMRDVECQMPKCATQES